MIYVHNTYKTENLGESDFRLGLGFDLSLIGRIREIKGVKKENDSYYLFTHTSIDGVLREERYHPLLGKILIEKETGKRIIIESLHKHWLSGYYWCIVYRMDGTRSHGTAWVKNINSIDKLVIESIKETDSIYEFEEKNLTFDSLILF